MNGPPSPTRTREQQQRVPQRETLPPGWALVGLPDNIAAEFHRAAKRIIATKLVPFLWLRHIRKTRRQLRAARQHGHPPASVRALLKANPILAAWPDAQLQTLSLGAVLRPYRRGEIIVHAREPCAPAMTFLATGSVEEYRTADETATLIAASSAAMSSSAGLNMSIGSPSSFAARKARSHHGGGDRPTTVKGVLQHPQGLVAMQRAGYTMADSATISEEVYPRYFVAAEDHVDVIEIPRHVLVQAFQQLPPQISAPLLKLAAQQREASLITTLPLTESRVRLTPLFAQLTQTAISAILKRVTPACFGAGAVIAPKDKVPQGIFFIRRGLVAFVDTSGRRVRVLRDGASVGAQELYFAEKMQHALVALCNCDCYVLKPIDLVALRANELYERTMHQCASTARDMELLAVRETRSEALSEAVRNIPLLNLFGNEAVYAEVAAAMHPRVLNSPDSIASTADACDRLIVISRGVARVRTSAGGIAHYFHVGECIGYTCLVQHRWLHPVAAAESVDIWEVKRDVYAQILKRHGIYLPVVRATLQLMQPLLRRPGGVQRADIESVALSLPSPNSFPHLKTPNMHPISLDPTHAVYHPWQPEAAGAKRTRVPLSALILRPPTASGTIDGKAHRGTLLRIPDEALLQMDAPVGGGGRGAATAPTEAALEPQASLTPTTSSSAAVTAPAAVHQQHPDHCVGASCRSGVAVVDAFGNPLQLRGFEFPQPPLNRAGLRPVIHAAPVAEAFSPRGEHTTAADDDGSEGSMEAAGADRTPARQLHSHLAPTGTTARRRRASSTYESHADQPGMVTPRSSQHQQQQGQETDMLAQLRNAMKNHRERVSGPRARQDELQEVMKALEARIDGKRDAAAKRSPPGPAAIAVAPPPPPIQDTKSAAGRAVTKTPRPPSAPTAGQGVAHASAPRPGTAPSHSGAATARCPAPPPPTTSGTKRTADGRFMALPHSASQTFGSLLAKVKAAHPAFSWHSSADAGIGAGIPPSMMKAFLTTTYPHQPHQKQRAPRPPRREVEAAALPSSDLGSGATAATSAAAEDFVIG